MGRFKLVKKGDIGTPMDAAKANQLFEFLNAVEDMQISPQGYGKLYMGKKNMVLDLGAMAQMMQKFQAALTAVTQTTSAGSSTGAGGSDLTAIKQAINGIIAALNATTITLSCNPTTNTITGTVVIPGIPGPLA